MKYYTHKTTGELMASIENLRDLIIDGETKQCITDVIFPYRWLGNGIISHCMSYVEIHNNYKQISKKKAIEICSDFGQYRHVDDDLNRSVTWLAKLHNRELEPIRKFGFGTPFTDKAKVNRKEFDKQFNSEQKKKIYETGCPF
jgi:hypothetical protein